jgi:hypothetical protein
MLRRISQLQHLWIFLAAIAVVLLTRLSIVPGHLYSFDSINLALALDDFNPARNQPQPPGYPFFVAEAKLVKLVFPDPWLIFTLLKIAVSALTLATMFWLGRTVRSTATGVAAAVLLAFAPTFWYASLTSALRLHLALFSAVVALLLWRAIHAEGPAGRRWFYFAAILLGAAAGFRPELLIGLTPLLLWTGWRVGGARLSAVGVALMIPPVLMWMGVVTAVMGGMNAVVAQFGDYVRAQGGQSSVLMEASQMGWRRMAARAVIWTFIGALAWIWALPLVWRRCREWSQWPTISTFVLFWFLPPFLFNLLAHTADPDHTLMTLPALCLVGALCLVELELAIPRDWLKITVGRGTTIWMTVLAAVPLLFTIVEPRGGNLAVWGALATALLLIMPRRENNSVASARATTPDSVNDGVNHPRSEGLSGPTTRFRLHHPLLVPALAINAILFFVPFPLPKGRIADGAFRGMVSLADAVLIGTYETSYRRVDWTEKMTEYALSDIRQMRAKLQAEGNREMVVIWSRDGAPEWRKIAFYYPDLKVVVLEETGDPAASRTRALLWKGKDMQKQLLGDAPIRIDVPAGGRVVWVLAGGRERELSQVAPIRKGINVFYTDVPASGTAFQWGSFEFVAPPLDHRDSDFPLAQQSEPEPQTRSAVVIDADTRVASR